MPEKIVEQDTLLGRAGLEVLFEKGFRGPNYNLSDIKIYVNKLGEDYSVSFWDMNCKISPRDNCYKRIDFAYKESCDD